MTETLSFSRVLNPSPTTDKRRAEILAAPGFGTVFTDHMVTIQWSEESGWHNPTLEPYHSLALDPATTVLHYGQAIFEGVKVYRQPDGSVAAFRPEMNARRFQYSARRIAMPELPEELFLESMRQLLAVEHEWVPTEEESALYIRPLMIATEAGLGVNRPANSYLYLVIASPVGSYFRGGVKPVTVWLSREYVRAAPGGTGAAKFAGNYAASFAGQSEAVAKGCDQVVWLDALEHKAVEEMGGMNLFFVFGSGQDARLVTPELSGSLLPGVIRDSLLRLGKDLGFDVTQRRITTDEWVDTAASGELTEVFACGTAAMITPVGHVKHAGGAFTVADGQMGPVTSALRERLIGIQHGRFEDTHGWLVRMP